METAVEGVRNRGTEKGGKLSTLQMVKVREIETEINRRGRVERGNRTDVRNQSTEKGGKKPSNLHGLNLCNRNRTRTRAQLFALAGIIIIVVFSCAFLVAFPDFRF
jgi:hypothetical protein